MNEWRRAAPCLLLPEQEKDRLFFSNSTDGIAEGKALCERCPVLEQCREDAEWAEAASPLSRTRLYGVVGGETVVERIARRKAAREAAA